MNIRCAQTSTEIACTNMFSSVETLPTKAPANSEHITHVNAIQSLTFGAKDQFGNTLSYTYTRYIRSSSSVNSITIEFTKKNSGQQLAHERCFALAQSYAEYFVYGNN